MRLAVVAAGVLLLGGCFSWQPNYDNAARRECGNLINVEERQACRESVERNAAEKRAEARS